MPPPSRRRPRAAPAFPPVCLALPPPPPPPPLALPPPFPCSSSSSSLDDANSNGSPSLSISLRYLRRCRRYGGGDGAAGDGELHAGGDGRSAARAEHARSLPQ